MCNMCFLSLKNDVNTCHYDMMLDGGSRAREYAAKSPLYIPISLLVGMAWAVIIKYKLSGSGVIALPLWSSDTVCCH